MIGALASDNVQAYGDATITIEDTFTSVQAQRFVFTVTQRGPVYGPRVFELDGFSAPVSVPEPTTLAMATAGLAVAAIAKLGGGDGPAWGTMTSEAHSSRFHRSSAAPTL